MLKAALIGDETLENDSNDWNELQDFCLSKISYIIPALQRLLLLLIADDKKMPRMQIIQYIEASNLPFLTTECDSLSDDELS